MKKQDELDLWKEVHSLTVLTVQHNRYPTIIRAIEVFKKCGMPPKRGYYLLEKWFGNDLVSWGINANGFWLTDKGRETSEL